MAALLEVSHVDLFRGETQVLWDICLSVEQGERVAILGSNGAGKSSFLAAVTATLTPASGDIRFDGVLSRRQAPAPGDRASASPWSPKAAACTRTCPSAKTSRWGPSPRTPAAG